MPTIGESVLEARTALRAAGIQEDRIESELLVAEAVRRSRSWVLAHLADTMTSAQMSVMRSLCERRCKREPLSYILGHKEFFGLDFAVSPGVLIPRQETEHLVDTVLAWLSTQGSSIVVEVGAGSGCVGIAIAAAWPKARVVAIERSLNALAIASANATAHHTALSGRYSLLNGDWMHALRTGCADVVVANLPYIGENEATSLAPEVRDWEPALALYGGDDGLEAFRAVIPAAERVLRAGGYLALEIGTGQAEAIAIIAEAHGFRQVTVTLDYAGIPRVLVARTPGCQGERV